MLINLKRWFFVAWMSIVLALFFMPGMASADELELNNVQPEVASVEEIDALENDEENDMNTPSEENEPSQNDADEQTSEVKSGAVDLQMKWVEGQITEPVTVTLLDGWSIAKVANPTVTLDESNGWYYRWADAPKDKNYLIMQETVGYWQNSRWESPKDTFEFGWTLSETPSVASKDEENIFVTTIDGKYYALFNDAERGVVLQEVQMANDGTVVLTKDDALPAHWRLVEDENGQTSLNNPGSDITVPYRDALQLNGTMTAQGKYKYEQDTKDTFEVQSDVLSFQSYVYRNDKTLNDDTHLYIFAYNDELKSLYIQAKFEKGLKERPLQLQLLMYDQQTDTYVPAKG